MTQAQLNAFINGTKNGTLRTRRAEIYRLILDRPMTLSHLGYYGHPINTASGRVSELMDLGLVKEQGSKFVAVMDEGEQAQLRSKRLKEVFDKWYKKGKEMGWIE